jgi:hypothetical protein
MDAVDARRLIAATIPEVEADLDAQAQRERHERARANRGVWAYPVEDGMARVGAELDQLTAARWSLDFEELVRARKALDDRLGITRTQAQRRADVFAAMPAQLVALARAAAKGDLLALLERARGAASPTPAHEQPDEPEPPPEETPEELLVQLLALPVRDPRTLHVHVPVTTLLDLDQRGGWLEGFGPVPALQARMLLASAALRRVVVDERTGVPLGVDPLTGTSPPWGGEFDAPAPRHRPHPERTAAQARDVLLRMLGAPAYVTDRAEPRHDPSSALREQVRLRDQGCDGPGCPRGLGGCELDHEEDYALGGVTAAWNLRHRSPRCHHAKHGGWTVNHDPETAVSTWTSPAGSSYQRRSAWQPPPELPERVDLPEPRCVEPLDLAPDRPDDDRPLWRYPQRH